jgi:hypothetical protein
MQNLYLSCKYKGKLIKEDIYARLDESKLFIGLLVNLISTLFPIVIESFVYIMNVKHIQHFKHSQIGQT